MDDDMKRAAGRASKLVQYYKKSYRFFLGRGESFFDENLFDLAPLKMKELAYVWLL